MKFTCNICGEESALEPAHRLNPETPSCDRCGSNIRFRWLAYRLSLELFGKPCLLKDVSPDRAVCGLGLTDPEPLASRLSWIFNYSNTYYDTEPRFDIRTHDSPVGALNFLIANEVFEHVTPPVSAAFCNAARLLKPEGVLLLTVPWVWDGEARDALPDFHDWKLEFEGGRWVIVDRRPDDSIFRHWDPVFDGGPGPCLGRTREHFTRLDRWALKNEDGRWVVENKLDDGRVERYENPVFHSGPGQALEMRLFTRGGLEHELKCAGFESIEFDGNEFPEFGIVFPYPWSLPIVARRYLRS